MQFKLQLPKGATEVENFIHRICDHYGFSDATISVEGDIAGNNLVISYPENYSVNHSPSMEKRVDSVPGLQC